MKEEKDRALDKAQKSLQNVSLESSLERECSSIQGPQVPSLMTTPMNATTREQFSMSGSHPKDLLQVSTSTVEPGRGAQLLEEYSRLHKSLIQQVRLPQYVIQQDSRTRLEAGIDQVHWGEVHRLQLTTLTRDDQSSQTLDIATGKSVPKPQPLIPLGVPSASRASFSFFGSLPPIVQRSEQDDRNLDTIMPKMTRPPQHSRSSRDLPYPHRPPRPTHEPRTPPHTADDRHSSASWSTKKMPPLYLLRRQELPKSALIPKVPASRAPPPAFSTGSFVKGDTPDIENNDKPGARKRKHDHGHDATSTHVVPGTSTPSDPPGTNLKKLRPCKEPSSSDMGPNPSSAMTDDLIKNPQCFEHGCNGRKFSTLGNLIRHQREESDLSRRHICPHCGSQCSSKRARSAHITHGKCKRGKVSARRLLPADGIVEFGRETAGNVYVTDNKCVGMPEMRLPKEETVVELLLSQWTNVSA